MLMKLMTGAAFAAAVLAGAAPAKAQSFQSVVETYYNDEFRAHPIAATDIGVHDYDAEVDDLSRDGQAKNTARLHKALDTLTAIDPATLSVSDRDDREILIGSIRGKLLDAETIRYWQKDPDVYVSSATSAVFNLVHRDFAPLVDRLRSVIAREREIPALLASGRANVEHPPRPFVEIAIRNVAGSIDFLKTGAPAAFAVVEDQELKREFAASNDSAIAAFEKYKTYLEQELIPKADGDFALGSDLFAKRMAYVCRLLGARTWRCRLRAVRKHGGRQARGARLRDNLPAVISRFRNSWLRLVADRSRWNGGGAFRAPPIRPKEQRNKLQGLPLVRGDLPNAASHRRTHPALRLSWRALPTERNHPAALR
jgi:hypothetical protein